MARISTSTAKDGDTLNIGKYTLTFVQIPMAHWPDNMVTYSDYDEILFSNDAFGQHYASSTRFEDASDYCEVMKQARKYYHWSGEHQYCCSSSSISKRLTFPTLCITSWILSMSASVRLC
ncbi:hypothetical protein [Lancefieldella rimae]